MNTLSKVSAIACITAAGSAFAADVKVIEQRFERTQLDQWVCLTEQHGYQMHFRDGVAAVRKQAGLEDGLVRLNGTYEVEGDFVTIVTASREELNNTGEMGIVMYHRNGEFNDIFFYGSNFIIANMFQFSGGKFESVANSDPTVRLAITRIGETVSLIYLQNNQQIVLHQCTGPSLAGPAKLGLFLVSEYATPEPLSGWFDDWFVGAYNVIREGCLADLDDGTFEGRRDCGVTIDDLIYFLRQYTLGTANADLDDGTATGTPDGGVTTDDLLFFLEHYYAGC